MKNAESSERRYEYRWRDHVYEECKYRWLWPGWIQRGAINAMSDEFMAQYVVTDIVNRIHRGLHLPDGWIAEPHPVVMLADSISVSNFKPSYPAVRYDRAFKHWNKPNRTQEYLDDFRGILGAAKARGHEVENALVVIIEVAGVYDFMKDALNVLVSEGHTVLVPAPCYRFMGFDRYPGVFPGLEVEDLEDSDQGTHRLHSGYQHPAATPIDFVSQDDRGPWWVCRDRYQISGGYEGE